MSTETEKDYKCNNCGESCSIVEEVFDYAGSHCTNGEAGTHRTGEYYSDCCGAGFEGYKCT